MSLTRSSSASPSMPDMRMSVSVTATSSAANVSRASSALATAATRQPASSSSREMMARIRSSSSATRMSGCVLIGIKEVDSRQSSVGSALLTLTPTADSPAVKVRLPSTVYRLLLLVPLGGEQRVGDEVFEVVVNPLGLPVRALLREAEALGDAAAADVGDRAVDLDAVEAQLPEGVRDERAARARHQAAPLILGPEPVADVGLAVRPVDVVVADAPGDAAAVEDERGEAEVFGVLADVAPDELARVLDRVAVGRPRHPRRKVREVAPHERRQLLGEALVHGAQLKLFVYALGEHPLSLRLRVRRAPAAAARPPWKSARARARAQALAAATRRPGASRARRRRDPPPPARPRCARRAR